jgi:hypothetical protein
MGYSRQNGEQRMSYARWSDGDWYIFWHCSDSGSNRDEQALAIWYAGMPWETFRSYTYKEIKKDKEKIWDKLEKLAFDKRLEGRLVFDEALDAFIHDVDNDPDFLEASKE